MSYHYYPQSATGLNYITYPAGPTAQGLLVTSNAAANTKGSYTEVVASAPFTANGMFIEFVAVSLSAQALFDVAIGGSGSEVVVIPDLIASGLGGSSVRGAFTVFFPLAVSSGSRIAIRSQDSTGGGQSRVAVTLVAAGDTPGCSTFVAYGADTATSLGALIDPGGSADTKGAYTQLTASTSAVGQYAVLVTNGSGNAAPSVALWAMDLATGGAGSETVLVPDLRGAATTDPGKWGSPAFSFPTYIASGTRVALRASCNITDATDRKFRAALYLATAPAEPSSGSGGSSTWFGGV